MDLEISDVRGAWSNDTVRSVVVDISQCFLWIEFMTTPIWENVYIVGIFVQQIYGSSPTRYTPSPDDMFFKVICRLNKLKVR